MSQVHATCAGCDAHFYRPNTEAWRRLCLPCWRAQNGRAAGKLAALQTRCDNLERQLMAATRPATATPPKPVIRFLLKTAHPDRHGGSAEATEALRWLLSVREEANHDTP